MKRYLCAYPLPPDFHWFGKQVLPKHRTLKGGYGKWLAETPNHQGLFEAICRILIPARILPTQDELVFQLNREQVSAEIRQPTLHFSSIESMSQQKSVNLCYIYENPTHQT